MTKQLAIIRAAFDIPYFAEEILGITLMPHQIDILRSSHEPLGKHDRRHGLGEFPRQSGLSLMLAVIATHTLIYGENKKIILVNHNMACSTNCLNAIKELVNKAQNYMQGINKITLNFYNDSITSAASQVLVCRPGSNFKGISVQAVYLDTCKLTLDQHKDMLGTIASSGRLFAYSTGLSDYIKALAMGFNDNNIDYQYLTVDPLKIHSVEYIKKFINDMGFDAAKKEFLL